MSLVRADYQPNVFTPKKDQQLSCRDGAAWDRQHPNSKTGWGTISKARAGKPFTRSSRVRANKVN